eukprot:354518-Chlamydomonas_euryale.AAC.1
MALVPALAAMALVLTLAAMTLVPTLAAAPVPIASRTKKSPSHSLHAPPQMCLHCCMHRSNVSHPSCACLIQPPSSAVYQTRPGRPCCTLSHHA